MTRYPLCALAAAAAMSALVGCTTAKRAFPAAALRSGCDADKIEVVSQDGHDVVLNVCGVHEKWHWHPLNGYEYVGPTADQPVAAPQLADRDNDGVPDNLDACPDAVGQSGPDPATNGCPPPTDSDGDGVPDDKDACKTVSGAANPSDPSQNGCPPDGDKDGVPDAQDACVATAGVRSEDPRMNGCPPDGDKDGVPDSQDACADVPGPKNADPTKNGCPTDVAEPPPPEEEAPEAPAGE